LHYAKRRVSCLPFRLVVVPGENWGIGGNRQLAAIDFEFDSSAAAPIVNALLIKQPCLRCGPSMTNLNERFPNSTGLGLGKMVRISCWQSDCIHPATNFVSRNRHPGSPFWCPETGDLAL